LIFRTDFPERGHSGKLKAGLFDFALGASILEIFFNCFSLLLAWELLVALALNLSIYFF